MDLNSRLLTLNMDINELYEIFLHEINKKIKEGNNDKILKGVIFGIKFVFSMENYLKGRYVGKSYIKQVKGREVGNVIEKIKINGIEILKEEFEDELVLRVRMMRSWLWENMSMETLGLLRETALGVNQSD